MKTKNKSDAEGKENIKGGEKEVVGRRHTSPPGILQTKVTEKKRSHEKKG